MTYNIDHLVISASDLASGRGWAEDLLDISLTVRGEHRAMGTHNVAAALDNGSYLEVIAVDPDAPPPAYSRWFDLDNFGGPPRLTNWVVNCVDLDEAWERAPANVGRIMSFTRGPYAWRMIVPEDGKLIFDGCFPALIEWQSEHPAPDLPNFDLRLKRLKLAHPDAPALRAALAPFVEAMEHVSISDGRRPSLQAEIGTPSGEIWIT